MATSTAVANLAGTGPGNQVANPAPSPSMLPRARIDMHRIEALATRASSMVEQIRGRLLAPEARGWDLPPAPVHLIEVIDRLLEGDAIVAVRAGLGRALPACLISGDTDADLMQRAKALGLTLLHKPVRPAKLRSLLRSIAAQ